MTIDASETVIRGSWRVVGNKMEADENVLRIERLVHQSLKEVGRDPSGWDVLYVDPDDGRFWELVYLDSESQGGGPPTLRHIPVDECQAKYGVALVKKEQRSP